MTQRLPFLAKTLLWLLLAALPLLILKGGNSMQAGEADPADPADIGANPALKKEKPKIPPLKFSAWCAFRDLSSNTPTPKLNPASEESRIGSSNWIGFGRRGQWAILVLEFTNTTEETAYSGSATVTLYPLQENDSGQFPYRNTYKIEFEVGPQSTKQYRMSVRCPENAWSEPIKINISANGGAGGTRYVQLRDLEGKDFIVVVSESSGAFRHLSTVFKNQNADGLDIDGMGASGGPSDQRTQLRDVAVVEPKELPTRWHDLMLANLIIIDGPPREKLSDAQWDALKSYVEAGGHILITAGKDPSRLKGPIEELAGVTVREMVFVSSLDTFADVFASRKTIVSKNNPDGTEPVQTETPPPEWTLPLVDVHVSPNAKSASLPQYNKKTGYIEQCRRYYGSGSVTLLPFSLSDKQLENWSGRTDIPLQLLELGRGRKIFGLDHVEAEAPKTRNLYDRYKYSENESTVSSETLDGLRYTLDESFAKDTPVEMQKPSLVMSFLLIYLLCAVPLNYFIFGWFKRREVAWLAIPLWTVGFSLLAYTFGYMGKGGKLTVNEVSIVEAGPGQEIGIARTFVGLYAPQRDNYRLNFPGANSTQDLKGFDVQAAPAHLINLSFAQARNVDLPQMEMTDDDAGLHVENLLVQQRATRRLEVLHRVSLKGGLDVIAHESATNANTFATLEVTNNTGYDLFHPVLISQGKAIVLGQREMLRTGENCKMSNVGVSTPDGIPWGDANAAFFGRSVIFRGVRGPHAAKRIEALSNYVRKRLDDFQGDVICAYIEGPMLPIELGAGAKGELQPPGTFEGITLFLAPVTVKKYTRSAVSSSNASKNFGIRYSLDYDPQTQTGEWQGSKNGQDLELAPMEKSNTGNSVFLELQLPDNIPSLLENRLQLVLNGKLAVSPTKKLKGKVIPQTVPAFNGDLKIEIMRTLDSGNIRWEELPGADCIFSNLDNVTPFKFPSLKIPLSDHRLRSNNIAHLRVLVTYSGEKRFLQLQGLNLKSVKKD